MVSPFFARFLLVFHRQNIKNAPRILAEGGKGLTGVCLAGTCGGRSSACGAVRNGSEAGWIFREWVGGERPRGISS